MHPTSQLQISELVCTGIPGGLCRESGLESLMYGDDKINMSNNHLNVFSLALASAYDINMLAKKNIKLDTRKVLRDNSNKLHS